MVPVVVRSMDAGVAIASCQERKTLLGLYVVQPLRGHPGESALAFALRALSAWLSCDRDEARPHALPCLHEPSPPAACCRLQRRFRVDEFLRSAARPVRFWRCLLPMIGVRVPGHVQPPEHAFVSVRQCRSAVAFSVLHGRSCHPLSQGIFAGCVVGEPGHLGALDMHALNNAAASSRCTCRATPYSVESGRRLWPL